MIKPILVPTGETNSPMVIEMCKKQLSDLDVGQLAYTPRLMHSKEYFDCYDIILIDTKAKIVDGDWVYENSSVSEYVSRVRKDNYGYLYHFRESNIPIYHTGWDKSNHNAIKILASTNKAHNLPQISTQAEQFLINYYNENKEMPEKVEVELHEKPEDFGCDPAYFGESTHVINNKQGTVDISIHEVQEKLYPEEEVLVLMRGYLDYYRFVDKRIITPEEFLKKRKQ